MPVTVGTEGRIAAAGECHVTVANKGHITPTAKAVSRPLRRATRSEAGRGESQLMAAGGELNLAGRGAKLRRPPDADFSSKGI